MEQYISKAALVAEIERRRKLVSDPVLSGNDLMIGERNALFNLLSFINTLEVKEVDLEKEIDSYFAKEWEGIEKEDKPFYDMIISDLSDIAKHFFELGLNVQCKISYVPNIDDSLEELGVDPTSKEAKIFKESYYIALEKLKAQKGE